MDLSKYKKIFTTTNSTELKEIMEEIFSPISITIQEPGKQAIVGEASLSDYSLIKNSTTGEVGKGTIKVKYLNENKKEIKAEDKVIEDREWNSVFEITPQKIEGYEFLESSGPLKDIVGDGARTITLTYKTIEKNRTIPFNTIYKEDNTKEKGMQEIEREGENGLEAYSEVDSDYSRVIKEKIDRIVKVGTKQTTKVESLPSPVRYEKDNSREKGQENITVKGKDGNKTTTTTYTVNLKTGEVVPNVGKSVVVEPTETVIKIAAKDKVEVVNKKDGETIKITTSYEVNPKTGEIKEVKREDLLSKKGIPEVSEESTEFKGGVNPTESIVREDLPELKVAIIKDKENNILDVIKEDEEPKEIKGYKNTGKTEVDKDGHKVYIYEKVEESKSTPKENKVENTSKEEDNKENKKEVISKKEELPKTSASMLSTVGLFSIFGLRKNRKKDK